LFKKSASLKDRANAALANLQRNAYAMGMLRSRLESRINSALNQKGSDTQELARVLELVKNGELILHEMSEKIESARFLEEFVAIMDSAAASVGEIKGDLEQMVPAAEAALEEMHDAISKASLPADIRQEIEPSILAEVAAAIAASKPVEQAAPAKEEEEPEPVPA
jgi:predicted  nucleic acid-binding Zn-ribbon protein